MTEYLVLAIFMRFERRSLSEVSPVSRGISPHATVESQTRTKPNHRAKQNRA